MNSFRTAGNFLRALLPGTVRVQGSSMEPTFTDGDWLLVRWAGAKTSAVSDVIVAEREVQPGIYYIKRITEIKNHKYWLSSDNPAGTDSRTWGWINAEEIRGKVLFRYYRKQRRN
jgi:phage repressor protein C with HTH and peptisase S24 domain